MDIFIHLKKRFISIGIVPDEKSNFNTKHLMIISLFACCFIGMITFILFESKSLMEFGLSFYGAATCGVNILTFSSNILERSKIFELITRFENIIEKRKFYSLFFCFIRLTIVKFYRTFTSSKYLR